MKNSMSFFGATLLAFLFLFSSCEKANEITKQEAPPNVVETEFIKSDKVTIITEAEFDRLVEDANAGNVRSCCSGISVFEDFSWRDVVFLSASFEIGPNQYVAMRHFRWLPNGTLEFMGEDPIPFSSSSCIGGALSMAPTHLPSGDYRSLAAIRTNSGGFCGGFGLLEWSK